MISYSHVLFSKLPPQRGPGSTDMLKGQIWAFENLNGWKINRWAGWSLTYSRGAEPTQPYLAGEAADAQSGTKVVSVGLSWMQALVRFGCLCKVWIWSYTTFGFEPWPLPIFILHGWWGLNELESHQMEPDWCSPLMAGISPLRSPRFWWPGCTWGLLWGDP